MNALTARPAGERHASPPARPGPDFACVELDLVANRAEDAIRELHERLCAVRPVRDRDFLLQDLLARHAHGASCLDALVAFPHARTAAIDEILVAVGRSGRGVWYDAQHRAIRLVILVAAPAHAVGEYLECTVGLARRLRDPAAVQALIEAPTADEFRAVWAGLRRPARAR